MSKASSISPAERDELKQLRKLRAVVRWWMREVYPEEYFGAEGAFKATENAVNYAISASHELTHGDPDKAEYWYQKWINEIRLGELPDPPGTNADAGAV